MTLNSADVAPPRFDSAARDRYFWDTLTRVVGEHGLSLEEVLRHYPAFAMRRDFPRLLSHYELFKQVIDLPGCIVEIGVWMGASFFSWAKFLEIHCPYDRSRKVFGFDHFKGLTQFSEQDGRNDDRYQKVEGGYRSPAEVVRTLVKLHNSDNMIPGTERCVLVEGDLFETIPSFLQEQPGLRIALLHIDVDLYEPTKFALEQLYPLVLKGGIVCLDEYGLIPWQGETRAADEYFAARSEAPTFRKHAFAQTPHGYFIKE
jgi:hypothetical protein